MISPENPSGTNRGSESSRGLSKKPLSRLQVHFLLKVVNLVDMRRTLSKDHPMVNLVDYAIYANYRDCCELGIGDDASTLIHYQREDHSQKPK